MKSKLMVSLLVLVIIVSVVIVADQAHKYVAIESYVQEEGMLASVFSTTESILTKIGQFFGWIKPQEVEQTYDFPPIK